MADPARKRATYEDVLGAPEHCIAQVIDGELHTQPRPEGPHQSVASMLGGELFGPFRRGRGGPGGWILLDEPELHLASDILVPDWACEILSPSTARIDRVKKLPMYAKHGVKHVWMIDPLARTLEVFRLEGERFFLHGTHAEDEVVRAEPFDAIELELSILWADLEPLEQAP